MDANRMKVLAVSVVTLGALSLPAVGSAQSYRSSFANTPAMVVECGPGQRAVLEQRQLDSGTQLVARCVGTQARSVRRVAPTRTKTKTALMIAGSAASGAGVGGALKGKKGALIGAAIGGGAASIYESAKRR